MIISNKNEKYQKKTNLGLSQKTFKVLDKTFKKYLTNNNF